MEIRAAVLEGMGAESPYASTKPLGIETLQLDQPGPGEVLVRIRAAGLCHSDLSVINGDRAAAHADGARTRGLRGSSTKSDPAPGMPAAPTIDRPTSPLDRWHRSRTGSPAQAVTWAKVRLMWHGIS